MEDIGLDFQVVDDDLCTVCGDFGAGVKLKLGYNASEFVCQHCIDEYIEKARAKLKNKVGNGGEMFQRIEKNRDTINRVQELAKREWIVKQDLFRELTDIFETLFPNGITSGSPVEVGKVDGNKVVVGGSGIGIHSNYYSRAQYKEKYIQVELASRLWRDIVPELSNYQDRSEKFEKFFKAFEEKVNELRHDPYNDQKQVQYTINFSEPVRYGDDKGRQMVVRNKWHYNSVGVYITSQYNNIPMAPPDDHLEEWLDILPQLEKALEEAKNRNSDLKAKHNKIIDSVEEAVKTWYTANSISL